MLDEGAPKEPAGGGTRIGLGIFIGGLAAALIAGFGLGKVTGQVAPAGNAPVGTVTAQPTGGDGHAHGGPQATAGSEVGGLAISAGGYTLTPIGHDGGKLSFVIKGPDGAPVTAFAIVHEKPLHLVVVRRDLTGYQHLHPTMAPDGTWSVAADLGRPGAWRVFADFATVNAAGVQTALTLGYDITVPGEQRPAALPAPARESTVDGYTVTYEGTANVGATQPMLFRVYQNGAPVSGLEPYLGSFGHLVVLRDGDLAYVHVHPEPQLVSGAVKFWIAAPSPGTYRLFFDYQVAGTVHTAEFTLAVK